MKIRHILLSLLLAMTAVTQAQVVTFTDNHYSNSSYAVAEQEEEASSPYQSWLEGCHEGKNKLFGLIILQFFRHEFLNLYSIFLK